MNRWVLMWSLTSLGVYIITAATITTSDFSVQAGWYLFATLSTWAATINWENKE